MLSYFLGPGPGYAEWLDTHRDDYVIVVEAGPREPGRGEGQPDHGVLARTRHRATCIEIRAPGPSDTSIAGPPAELDDEFQGNGTGADIADCPACRP